MRRRESYPILNEKRVKILQKRAYFYGIYLFFPASVFKFAQLRGSQIGNIIPRFPKKRFFPISVNFCRFIPILNFLPKMGNDAAKVLSIVPEYKGEEVIISNKQSTNKIVREVIDAHYHFAGDYDLLVKKFPFKKSVSLEEQLFDFCKSNLRYRAESVDDQTTRSPAGIVELGQQSTGVDCKHYAGYIGGVLDAYNRSQKKIVYDWWYRFASYDDNTEPGHVFIVVMEPDGELWIDPVLSEIDKRKPAPRHILDKKISDMTLSRLSGVTQLRMPASNMAPKVGAAAAAPTEIEASQVKTQTSGQSKIETVGTALETVSAGLDVSGVGTVAGVIVGAVGAVVKIAGNVFGSKWTLNNEVRWLIQMYQFYVLGDASVKSDNDVDQSLLQPALNWFFAVLGVPVYDANTVAILATTNSQGKKVVGVTAGAAAAAYLSYPQIKQLALNTSLAEATQGAEIAISSLNFYGNAAETANPVPGQWANLPVAQVWIDAAAAQGVQSVDTNGNLIPATQPNFFQNAFAWIKANPVPAAIGAAVIVGGLVLIFHKPKKSKRK